jgi:hypothetical protein
VGKDRQIVERKGKERRVRRKWKLKDRKLLDGTATANGKKAKNRSSRN